MYDHTKYQKRDSSFKLFDSGIIGKKSDTTSAYIQYVYSRYRIPTYIHTYIHTNITSPPRADPNFLTHFAAKDGPSIFEWGQHLAREVLTRVYMILTRSGLLFIFKTVREITSIPRADLGYPHNFRVDFCVFKDDESIDIYTET